MSDKAKGGKARADALSPERRSEIARTASMARWADKVGKVSRINNPTGEEPLSVILDQIIDPIDPNKLPSAMYRGYLNIVGMDVPCYVLSDGQRVIGRTSATEVLTGIKGGGGLEKYLGVKGLEPFINMALVLERMLAFRLPEVEGLEKAVKGLPADLFIEICQGFVAALEAHHKPDSPHPRLTERQQEMALKAGMFLAACAKIGLDALIDEATGAQFDRAEDALQIKLRAYLSDEMRKWERTFPNELWVEFGRLTGWRGSVTKRPKYWGKLVNELVYEYMDPDVAKWLRENAPAPKHGQNYHQWLSAQFGLKKLVEHIWMLIGVAKTCESMLSLRDRMAELNGKMPVQYRLYLPRPKVD
jgi:P63C domain